MPVGPLARKSLHLDLWVGAAALCANSAYSGSPFLATPRPLSPLPATSTPPPLTATAATTSVLCPPEAGPLAV